MKAVKFLKLDLKLMKSYARTYMLLPLIFLVFLVAGTPAFALNYMMFFIVIISNIPFSLEGVEKCEKLYYVLPAKTQNMVLGRYLFLFSVLLLASTMDTAGTLYFYSVNKITGPEIMGVCITGLVGCFLCLFQFPIFYRFGYEKGRVASMLLYMLPAFVVFFTPTLFSALSKGIDLTRLQDFLSSNVPFLALLIVLALGLAAYLSYSVSCKICLKKEI